MKGSAFCSYAGRVSIRASNHRHLQEKWEGANLEVFIRGLLPLLVHGVWCGPGRRAHQDEDDEGGEETNSDASRHLLALIRRR